MLRRLARRPAEPVQSLEMRRLLSVVGYAEATNLNDFLGSLQDGSVIVRDTRYGDANLDGTVNLTDFTRLYANFNRSGATWQQGDFNYDGVVNLSDFNLLASNFGISAGPDGPTPADWAALAAAVPGAGGTVNQPPSDALPKFAVTRGGTLTVTGTKNRDTIIIDSSTLDQMKQQYPKATIRRVHVDAGAGDDYIEMKVSLPATLIGGKGNDYIIGGARNDLLSGGAGDDTLNGGSGNDTLEGLAGKDQLSGSAGADLLLGGAGDDVINGGSGDDTLRGGAGYDLLAGNAGHNLFYGDAGADTMRGGGGNDRFVCIDDGAVDHILGHAGFDRIRGHDPLDIIDLGTQ